MARSSQPDQLFRSERIVAFVVNADDLFGTFSRSYDLPVGWGGLAIREDGTRVFVPAGTVLNRGQADEYLLIRDCPFQLELSYEDIPANDQYLCSVICRLSVRVSSDSSEMASFRNEVMGNLREFGLEDLVSYIRSAVHKGLQAVARQYTAAQLVDGDTFEVVRDGLADAMNPLCFKAGLILREVPLIRFESSTLGNVRIAAEKAVADEARFTARRDLELAIESAREKHSQHLAGLLDELHVMSEESPEVSMLDILKTFREQDRGELYSALLDVEEVGSVETSLVIAAGEGVYILNPAEPESESKHVLLNGVPGAVRSVRPGVEDTLLIGAARGVYELTVDGRTTEYCVPENQEARGGFNSVAVGGERIWASHSDLGLLAWKQGTDGEPAPVLSAETTRVRTVRSVLVQGSHVYCLIGDRVAEFHLDFSGERADPEAVRWFTGSEAPLTALSVSDEFVHAGNADGTVLEWSLESPSSPRKIHIGQHGSVESVHVLGKNAIPRLLYSDSSSSVSLSVLGDAFSCRFEAGGQKLRRVVASAGIVVAINDLRDRFFIWRTGEPSVPTHSVQFTKQYRHSIQDLCLW